MNVPIPAWVGVAAVAWVLIVVGLATMMGLPQWLYRKMTGQ
jgi:hypothetical protein